MNRLSLLSLATLSLMTTEACAINSQYSCDKVVYENTLDHSNRRIRVCLSDVDVSITLEPKMDGYEGIDIKVPMSAVTYSQKGIANVMTFNIDDDTHYMVSNNTKNLRLLTMYENNISRAYRLSSPVVDDFSPSLGRYGISIK